MTTPAGYVGRWPSSSQRALARKTRFSALVAMQGRVEALHWKISNQRRDFLHRLTYRTEEFALIAVEDVSPRFMLANRRAVGFRRKLVVPLDA